MLKQPKLDFFNTSIKAVAENYDNRLFKNSKFENLDFFKII